MTLNKISSYSSFEELIEALNIEVEKLSDIIRILNNTKDSIEKPQLKGITGALGTPGVAGEQPPKIKLGLYRIFSKLSWYNESLKELASFFKANIG